MLSLVSEIWFIAISITVSIETVVAHHLQNVFGKSGGKDGKYRICPKIYNPM